MRLRTMKMKQISDTTLKITMSLEDLMDRGMEIADFLVPQEKTEEFFYASSSITDNTYSLNEHVRLN